MSGKQYDPVELKRMAAAAALEQITDGAQLGLGSGSTADEFVRLLAARIASAAGLSVRCCATSERTTQLAQSLGIEILPLESFTQLDFCVDGADEIDPQLNLIKGGGACHLREKVIARFALKLMVIADESKLVEQLGAFRVPLEIIPFALPLVLRDVRSMHGNLGFELRLAQGRQVMSDEGNLVADADFGMLADPSALAIELSQIPGLVEHGLFVGMAHKAIIATQAGIRILERQP